MILTVVRHGETDWNAQQRMMGQVDLPLNGRGTMQAERVALRLSNAPIDVIVTSDLSRAFETARAIASHHPQAVVVPDARFRERLFGVFQGRTRAETAERFPDVVAEVTRNPEHARVPEGETRAEMRARVRDGLENLLARYGDKRVLLVTHGGVLQRLVEILDSLGCHIDPGTEFPNTCVLSVDFSSLPPQVIAECDASHLGDDRLPDDGHLPV